MRPIAPNARLRAAQSFVRSASSLATRTARAWLRRQISNACAAAAERHPFAVRQDDLDREHVISRHAVLQAVRPAGVFGDVAADGASHLARWVGRVMKAGGRGRLRQLYVDDARLDDREAILVIELENAIEPRQLEDHRAAERQRAAR